MSNARGRRDGIPYSNNFPRPYRQPSWPNQPLNFFQSDHTHHPSWGEDSVWARPPYWDSGPQNNAVGVRPPWQRPCFTNVSPHSNFDHVPQQFDQFPQRFPTNCFPHRNGPQYSERSLVQIPQTSFEDPPTSGRTSRDGQRQPILTKPAHQTPPSTSSAQTKSVRNNGVGPNASNNNATGSSSQVPKNNEKPPNASTPKSSGIKPPSDDLRNIVKESLKTMTRGGNSPAQSATEEGASPSRRARESRKASGEQSQPRGTSGDAAMRKSAGEYHGNPSSTPRTPTGTRRRVQSQSSSEINSSSLLDGLGYIQRTPGDAMPSPSQNQAGEEEPVTISREQLSQYIRSMDNHQRRQLVEQPRDSISKSLLDHLVQENQTNKARQLSSLRFRVTSTDIELSSRSESTVMLSEELVEQIKELLAQQDAEDALPAPAKPTSSQPDDDEILIIEPPPKAPPICIDLDMDDQPSAPSQVIRKNSVAKKEADKGAGQSLDNLLAELNATISLPCTSNNSTTEPIAAQVTQPLDNVNSSTSTCSSVAADSERATELAGTQPTNEPQTTISETPIINQAPCEPDSQSINSNCTTEPSSSVQENGAASVTETEESSTSVTSDAATLSTENCRSENIVSTSDAPLEKLPSDVSLENENEAANTETTNTLVIESVTSLAVSAVLPEQQTIADESSVQVQPSANTTNLRLMELELEERGDVARLKTIDEMIEELQKERKVITDRLLVRKQHQFDILRSSWALHFNVPSAAASAASSTPQTSAPTATSTAEIPETTSSAKPPDKTTELLDLMLQLEQNGLHVVALEKNLGAKLTKAPPAKKRKRAKTQPVENISNMPTPSKKNASAVQSPAVVSKKKRKKSASNSFEVSPILQTNKKGSKKKKNKSYPNHAAETSLEVAAQTESSSQQKDAPRATINNSGAAIMNSEPVARPTNAQQLIVNESVREPVPPTLPPPPSQSNCAPPVPTTNPKASHSQSNEVPPAQAAKRPFEKEPAKRPEPSHPSPPDTPREPKVPRCTEPDQQAILSQLAADINPPEAASSVDSNISPSSSLFTSTGGGLLESHTTAVKTMFVNGPCLFTASEDGTVHVYDLASGLLSMRILGHQYPVTFLYAVSLRKTTNQLKGCPTTAEYLNNLNLITGSLDGFVRQFSLETGNVLHEIDCGTPVTCSAPNKTSQKLYIGTKSGAVLAFDPKTNDLRPARFKAQSEVLMMKALNVKAKKMLILSAAERNIMVYDCTTEERLHSLSTGLPNNSIRCISSSGYLLYCCDSFKRLFTFDLSRDKPLVRTEDVPSVVVSSFHNNCKYLFLACQDGVIRIIDTTKKTKNITSVAGPHPKTLSCMKFSGSKIICGTLAGEVFYRSIPRFAVGAPGTGK